MSGFGAIKEEALLHNEPAKKAPAAKTNLAIGKNSPDKQTGHLATVKMTPGKAYSGASGAYLVSISVHQNCNLNL